MRLSLKVLSINAKYFDIIISGGGMVGSAMACACGSQPMLKNKSVLLLEAGEGVIKQVSSDPETYSNRVSAINPSSKEFFEKLGIWAALTADSKIKPVKQLRVWDSCSTSKVNFEHDNFSQDVAYIVENNKIINACVDNLQSGVCKNVTMKNRSKVNKITLPNSLQELARVELADGSKFETSLLIGADGVQSHVRATMNSRYVSWQYGQKAIVATLTINTVGDNSVAWQRFTPTGPVALLPLTASKSSLVWTTTAEEAERLMTLPDDQFVDELNEMLWEEKRQKPLVNNVLLWLDTCAEKIATSSTKADQLPPTVVDIYPNSRAAFPLGFGHSTIYVKNRSALIGDAAHRVHPLAGQGVNLGFGDCETLSEILATAASDGSDIGLSTL